MVYAHSVGKPIGESLVIHPLQHIPWRRRKLKVFAKRLMVARNEGGAFITCGKQYPITNTLAFSQVNKKIYLFFFILTGPTQRSPVVTRQSCEQLITVLQNPHGDSVASQAAHNCEPTIICVHNQGTDTAPGGKH